MRSLVVVSCGASVVNLICLCVYIVGFVMGTRRLYDFLDDNPSIDMRDISWVNDIMVISRVCAQLVL